MKEVVYFAKSPRRCEQTERRRISDIYTTCASPQNRCRNQRRGCKKNAVEQWLVYQAHTLVSPEGPSIETRRRYLFCLLGVLREWFPPLHSNSYILLLYIMDTISINDLQIHLINGLGASAFGLSTPPPCPISLTLHIRLKDGIVSEDEDSMLGLGVNYSAVSKEVYATLSDRYTTWPGPLELMQSAASVPLALEAVLAVDVRLELPRALLHARSAVYGASFGSSRGEVTMEISALQTACVIGLHPHERAERQRLEVDLRFRGWKEGLGHRRVADIALKVS